MTKKTKSRVVGLLFVLGATALVLGVTVPAANGWWQLWMYHGWIGPPGFLHKVWPGVVDGETSYDVTFVEMYVVLFVLIGTAFIAIRRLQSRS